MQESPIFVRTFDLLAWLLPVAQKFPKEQRFALTARLQNAAFDFYEAITAASLLIAERPSTNHSTGSGQVFRNYRNECPAIHGR